MNFRPIRRRVGILLFLTLVLLSDTGWGQFRERRMDSRFDDFDSDGDGQLSGDEIPIWGRRFDRDQDQFVSPLEFRAAIRQIVQNRFNTIESQDWKPSEFAAAPDPDDPISKSSVLAAAKYNAQHQGVSFIVFHDGTLIYEDYPNGGGPDQAHELASGTRSFIAVMACAAVQDGLIRWDEPVSDTIRLALR